MDTLNCTNNQQEESRRLSMIADGKGKKADCLVQLGPWAIGIFFFEVVYQTLGFASVVDLLPHHNKTWNK
jgi:hypothetical protein